MVAEVVLGLEGADGRHSCKCAEEMTGDRRHCNVVNTDRLASSLEAVVTHPDEVDGQDNSEEDEERVGDDHHDENGDTDHEVIEEELIADSYLLIEHCHVAHESVEDESMRGFLEEADGSAKHLLDHLVMNITPLMCDHPGGRQIRQRREQEHS